MRRFVLIDGPSGSGKTTFAGELSRETGRRVVHLDDFYPGWYGLLAASEMVAEDVLHPSRPGFRRWDWEKNEPGEWVALDPDASYIIEGVGAVTSRNIAAARALGDVRTIRIEADAGERKRRALARDPGFARWWQVWAEQEDRYYAGPGAVEADEIIRS